MSALITWFPVNDPLIKDCLGGLNDNHRIQQLINNPDPSNSSTQGDNQWYVNQNGFPKKSPIRWLNHTITLGVDCRLVWNFLRVWYRVHSSFTFSLIKHYWKLVFVPKSKSVISVIQIQIKYIQSQIYWNISKQIYSKYIRIYMKIYPNIHISKRCRHKYIKKCKGWCLQRKIVGSI